MDATAAAEALVEWVKDTCPEIKGSYDHDPSRKDQPLPDVAAYATSEEVTATDPTTGDPIAASGIQQAELHIIRATLLLMVPAEPAEDASNALNGFVAALGASIKADQTLGGLVASVGPHWRATYEPPFIQFDDGTEGRAAYFSLTVASLS